MTYKDTSVEITLLFKVQVSAFLVIEVADKIYYVLESGMVIPSIL